VRNKKQNILTFYLSLQYLITDNYFSHILRARVAQWVR